MKGRDIAVRSILIVVIVSAGTASGKSTKGCLNAAVGVTGESIRKSLDPTRHSETNTLKDISALKKKSSVEKNTDCSETSHDDDKSTVTKHSAVDGQKAKIKALQTKIHTNLLKLFHRIKQKKLQEVVRGNRKDLGSLGNPGKAAQMVSDKVISLPFVTGVLKELNKSKSHDTKSKALGSSGNVTTGNALIKFENDLPAPANRSNDSSLPKALDKVVSHILQNSSEARQEKAKLQDAIKSANTTVSSGNHKSNNSQKDPSESDDNGQDPYAAIAAGPDHPKLPPALKVPENDDSVVPVSHKHHKEHEDSDEDEAPEAPLEGQEAPEPPEAPNQLPGAGMGGDVNPDLADANTMQQMRMEAMQDQMQDNMRAQAMSGMLGMGSMPRMNGMQENDMMGGMERMRGMNGMQGDDMMGGMGRMGGMQGMNGMRGDDMMGGMGRMTGMNGMQEGGMMAGMGGMQGMGGMLGMGGMRGMGGMAGYNDMEYGRDNILDDRYRGPYGMDGMGEDEPEPSTHMIDESAVGRDQVPLAYEERLRMPFPGYFHDPEMDEEGFPDEDDDDDDDEGDDRVSATSGRPRASFGEPYDDDGPENDMDDGYMDDYERKTKIAKAEDSKSGVQERNITKTSRKDQVKKETKTAKDLRSKNVATL